MNGTTDASAIFAPIWRRKWLILIIGAVVAAATYLHYKSKPTSFEVKTQLNLGAAAEGQSLLNNTLGKTNISATQITNQVALINSSIGEAVHKKFRLEHNGVAAKGKAKAKAVASSDFIALTAQARTPTAAAAVANAYAQTYIKRHQANYEAAVQSAITTTKRQIKRIEAAEQIAKAKAGKGAGSSSTSSTLQTAALSTKLNQLESDLTIMGVQQVGLARPAKAELIGPHPKQNAIFGFVIGLVLAAIAVVAASRLSRRLRSPADIEAAFGLPVLSVLPVSRTPIVLRDGQVRISKLLNEGLWRLQSTLALRGADGNAPRSLLFLSADAGDGKSTVAAGLALVQRDAFEQAVLVEADFRRPVQRKLLGIVSPGSHGLADVITGAILPLGAMQRVATGGAEVGGVAGGPQPGAVATAVTPVSGSVSVLLGSSEVANPPALLARREMVELLRSLGGEFDSVIVDAPSPLQVSDVIPLLGAVDGIVIVARVGHTRHSSAQRLMELLGRTAGAPVLGVVANAVPQRDIAKYGLAGGGGQRRWPMSMLGR